MHRSSIIRFPCRDRPFYQTVRFTHYARTVVRLLPVPMIVLYWNVSTLMLFFLEGQLLPFICTFLLTWPIALPSVLLVWRLMSGPSNAEGILSGKAETDNWRTRWAAIEEASITVQSQCKSSRFVFSLPGARSHDYDRYGHDSYYQSPVELLHDIPSSPSYVTYGHVIAQPVQAISTGASEEATALVRHVSSVLAGRILCKDLCFVVFQEATKSSVRLTFLTDVRAGECEHGFIWLTVQLQTEGRLVTGFVETVQTFYFEKYKYGNGLAYKGDDTKAKGIPWLVGETLLTASPICFFLAIIAFWKSLLELKDGRYSARFFHWYRVQAGDSVDLFLVGQSGTDLRIDEAYASTVESVRNDLVNEVHKTVGSYSICD